MASGPFLGATDFFQPLVPLIIRPFYRASWETSERDEEESSDPLPVCISLWRAKKGVVDYAVFRVALFTRRPVFRILGIFWRFPSLEVRWVVGVALAFS